MLFHAKIILKCGWDIKNMIYYLNWTDRIFSTAYHVFLNNAKRRAFCSKIAIVERQEKKLLTVSVEILVFDEHCSPLCCVVSNFRLHEIISKKLCT